MKYKKIVLKLLAMKVFIYVIKKIIDAHKNAKNIKIVQIYVIFHLTIIVHSNTIVILVIVAKSVAIIVIINVNLTNMKIIKFINAK
jgi:hypothetical protein